MREIEGIEQVMKILSLHLDEIEADFQRENERFKHLMSRDHDDIGHVLKCHLIVENYLDRFLATHYNIENLDSAKLSFFQKASLLPDKATAATFVKPGILKLNSIRNRFGHTLEPRLEADDLGPIREILEIARPQVQFDNAIGAIEAFTTVACTWLIIPNPEIQKLFMKAFSEVRITIE